MPVKKLLTFHLLTFALAAVILSTNVATAGSQEDLRIRNAIESIRKDVAPDRRVAVFDITWEVRGTRVLVSGEVDDESARDRVVSALQKAGFDDIRNDIVVLPHPGLGQNTRGIVRVSVAQMRSEPRFTSEIVTQVLMGTPLRVLKRQRGWFYVQSPDNYLGWMSAGLFQHTDPQRSENWETSEKVIVTDYHGMVYEEPSTRSLPVSNVSMGNRLRTSGQDGDWVSVALPDDRTGFIHSDLVSPYAQWKANHELTGDNIARTARKFIGIPYLWGGTSAKGFDCSGLTKIVFWLNGMDLSRDASQQILMGEHVDPGSHFENLKTGDLLFFGRAATTDTPERIVHVGIYLDNREFIHASYLVRINSLDPEAPHFDRYEYNRFVRARRLIP
ncbi:MAG: glycoside hydrolase [Balneolaceae bacterium]|nr:MAG: glycoside hydrolase [Balneolaceae bacterium]